MNFFLNLTYLSREFAREARKEDRHDKGDRGAAVSVTVPGSSCPPVLPVVLASISVEPVVYYRQSA